MIPPLLSTTALSCERGFRRLFSGIDLALNSREVLKVIGANGAGKSTLLKILSGQNNDYEGQVFFRGEPLARSRHQFSRDVCFLGHNSGIKKNLTAVENLTFFTHLYPCKNNISIQQALARLQLGAFADSLCGELSQGQQQRVAFARFLLSDAVLWILDEPFTAIDRSGIEIIEQVMTDFLTDDGAIIMTSHHEVNVSAVQTLCLGAMP